MLFVYSRNYCAEIVFALRTSCLIAYYNPSNGAQGDNHCNCHKHIRKNFQNCCAQGLLAADRDFVAAYNYDIFPGEDVEIHYNNLLFLVAGFAALAFETFLFFFLDSQIVGEYKKPHQTKCNAQNDIVQQEEC